MKNNPIYNLTEEMLNLVAEISLIIGEISFAEEINKLPNLQRNNRIKTIQASLAIENNTLTLKQVTDVINGKRVLGPQNEINEVRNAYEAYKIIEIYNQFSMEDLLKAHRKMMNNLVDDSRSFRNGDVGVFDGDHVVHMAPPAHFVFEHMDNLFTWMRENSIHPLIKSCIFHYEFEFIHPFLDGNGRIGRLWQTVILGSWKKLFYWIPVENMIKEKQNEYYEAIQISTNQASSNAFIVFMLRIIKEACLQMKEDVSSNLKNTSKYVEKLLLVMDDMAYSSNDLMAMLNIKSRMSFQTNYLKPAIEIGAVEMTIPEKPNSKNQRYIKKIG